MIEARTRYNKPFRIFCMKEPDYVMNIMVSWMTLDELEGAKTRRYFIDRSGTKETKQFTYRQPFGIHFRYRHQVYDKKIGYMCQFTYIGHGRPSSGLILNFPVILLCHKLIQILCQITF